LLQDPTPYIRLTLASPSRDGIDDPPGLTVQHPGTKRREVETPEAMLTITENTTVRELLTAHPETFPVLRKRGMCADCEAAPPPVTLHHFADKHCNGDVTGLLDELNRSRTNASPVPHECAALKPRSMDR
jgi:hypothetical protein